MVRYGIIGCGSISRFHFTALEKIGAQITYIADINQALAERYAQKFGSRVTTDYSELINSDDVDVVCILANSSIHKDAALKAIAAGKDVICEKTMMNNADDAFEVLLRAREAGTLFFTSYMKRFFPAAIKAKELVQSLGNIFSANVRSFQAWGDFYRDDHGWDINAVLKVYGGAIIKCAGSHMIDMMLHLLGRPDYLYASIDYYPNSSFDRKSTALFEYKSGLVTSFEAAAHPLKKVGYERNSWDEFIEINGTNGRMQLYTVMWNHPENNAALLVHYNNDTQTSTEYRFDAVNPFDVEIGYFNDCFEQRIQGSPGAYDGFNVDVMIESMLLSSQKHQSVEIDWRGVRE